MNNKEVTVVDSQPQTPTLASSELTPDKIVFNRTMELLGIIQQMGIPGVEMIALGVSMTETTKLQKLLSCLEKILRVVGKWDLRQESYEQAMNELIQEFIREINS